MSRVSMYLGNWELLVYLGCSSSANYHGQKYLTPATLFRKNQIWEWISGLPPVLEESKHSQFALVGKSSAQFIARQGEKLSLLL